MLVEGNASSCVRFRSQKVRKETIEVEGECFMDSTIQPTILVVVLLLVAFIFSLIPVGL